MLTIFLWIFIVLALTNLLFSIVFLFLRSGITKSFQSMLWTKNSNVYSPLGLSKKQLFVWRVVLLSRWGAGILIAVAMIIEITSLWRY